MYVALRMGAHPWPTIFDAVMSLAILKALGRTNLNEINVTHTAMSSGAMVAGGLAFTVPGIWILEASSEVSFLSLLVVTLSGTILGVVSTGMIRRYFIEKEKLPFPMGLASYETVVAGDKGGKKAKYLFSTMGPLPYFRSKGRAGMDSFAWSSVRLYSRNVFFGMWTMPLWPWLGYIIGPLFTGCGSWSWCYTITSYGLSVGVAAGWFADVGSATAFKDSLGIGLMVGTGVGILLKGILPRAREIYLPVKSSGKGSRMKTLRWIPLVFAAIALFLTTLTEMTLVSYIY
jgi:uncharacterized oligopeptide transporter (OPT) family protein